MSTPGRTGTRLDPILESVAARAAQRLGARSAADLRRELEPDPARRARFVGALRTGGLAFIAECKRRSPSVGALSDEVDLLARAKAYARGGAAAMSVLTEQDHFAGSPADLAEVAPAGLPRLRKDFVLDERMVLESVAMGADAILLLAVCLPDPLLGELRALANEVGLAVLLEVHDERELERGLAARPDCLGVNARDLRTFEVDLATVERLLPLVPGDIVSVAESGVRGLDELARVRAAGADAALVGEALMRAESPERTLAQWREALADG
ncbi:MAG: indole-3-glycerol-phosphate synthase [bacterium]|nr:indole-3-glycerol-phosphate synthase [bacterium]